YTSGATPMTASIRVSPLAVLIAGSIAASAAAQAPPEPLATPSAAPVVAVPAPPPAAAAPVAVPTPGPTQAPAMRITETSTLSIARLPAENPYGSTAQVPAALPTKLPFVDSVVSGLYYASIRVDPTGKAGLSRRERDPIPSLSAEALKS